MVVEKIRALFPGFVKGINLSVKAHIIWCQVCLSLFHNIFFLFLFLYLVAEHWLYFSVFTHLAQEWGRPGWRNRAAIASYASALSSLSQPPEQITRFSTSLPTFLPFWLCFPLHGSAQLFLWKPFKLGTCPSTVSHLNFSFSKRERDRESRLRSAHAYFQLSVMFHGSYWPVWWERKR